MLTLRVFLGPPIFRNDMRAKKCLVGKGDPGSTASFFWGPNGHVLGYFQGQNSLLMRVTHLWNILSNVSR